jgi:hypothetical protein
MMYVAGCLCLIVNALIPEERHIPPLDTDWIGDVIQIAREESDAVREQIEEIEDAAARQSEYGDFYG